MLRQLGVHTHQPGGMTLLCDGGQRYQSKLYNPKFLEEKNLPVPGWLKG